MKKQQVEELILQSLEHELGGVKVYTTALRCATHEELHEERKKYLEETRTQLSALEEAFGVMGIDPGKETPGRNVVRHNGTALV